jgi:voltage-gated potassium channel
MQVHARIMPDARVTGDHPRRVMPGAIRRTGQHERMTPERRRPHLFAGLLLPIRAVVVLARDPQQRGLVLLVVSLLIAGTVFYTTVEGWSVIDAVYFCAMSLATVGYGDVVPETDAGKLFTVIYVLAGIGTLVAFFSALAAQTLALQAERRRAGGRDQ